MIFSSLTASFSSLLLAVSPFVFLGDADAAAGGGFVLFFCCFFIVAIIVSVFLILIPLSKLFVKAGQPAWQAYVPYLNICVMAHIGGRDWWWGLVPFLNIVPYFDLAKAFGKSDGYGIGLIFLPWIFIPMLGFSDAQYQLEQRPPLF